MPHPQLSVHSLDEPNQRRRQVESINGILDHTFDDSRRQTAGEIAAGVTPINKAYLPYNRSRYASWSDWKQACDFSNQEGVVDGDWTLTADIELPHRSVFTGGTLSGSFTVLYRQRLDGWVKGLKCVNFHISGITFCTVKELYCTGDVTIDGYDGTWGTFWNEFPQWHVDGTLTIDITDWAVNLNCWRGGRISTLHITGNIGTYPTTQAHGNTFDAVDFTDGGVLQDDEAFEVNFLRSCYYEGGADIVGNFHIIGYQGDALSMPKVSRFCHIFSSVGRNPRTSRDFLSITAHNAARGGNWDWRDTSGKPPCLSTAGGAGISVATDTSEPGGTARRYEGTFSTAFSGFVITIQPNGTDKFGLCLFYRSVFDFEGIESDDGSGAISHGIAPVEVDSDWKMLRIAGDASPTATTTVSLFVYGAVGGAGRFFAIGSIFAGGERAVLSPHKNQDFDSGLYTPTLTNTTNVAASTAYNWQFSRLGNTVTVTGRLDIDPTAAAPTQTRIDFTLPIAPHTAFSAVEQVAGVGNSQDFSQSGIVACDSANQRGALIFQATNVASDTWAVSFSYRMS